MCKMVSSTVCEKTCDKNIQRVLGTPKREMCEKINWGLLTNPIFSIDIFNIKICWWTSVVLGQPDEVV